MPPGLFLNIHPVKVSVETFQKGGVVIPTAHAGICCPVTMEDNTQRSTHPMLKVLSDFIAGYKNELTIRACTAVFCCRHERLQNGGTESYGQFEVLKQTEWGSRSGNELIPDACLPSLHRYLRPTISSRIRRTLSSVSLACLRRKIDRHRQACR